jgi:hypothetical protein
MYVMWCNVMWYAVKYCDVMQSSVMHVMCVMYVMYAMYVMYGMVWYGMVCNVWYGM